MTHKGPVDALDAGGQALTRRRILTQPAEPLARLITRRARVEASCTPTHPLTTLSQRTKLRDLPSHTSTLVACR